MFVHRLTAWDAKKKEKEKEKGKKIQLLNVKTKHLKTDKNQLYGK